MVLNSSPSRANSSRPDVGTEEEKSPARQAPRGVQEAAELTVQGAGGQQREEEGEDEEAGDEDRGQQAIGATEPPVA